MSEKKDHNFLEALMEGAEAAWDLAVESEAVKAVPVVGTAFKFLKGVDDLRSRALMRKLALFLNEPSLRTALKAKALRQAVLDDPARAQETGEMLFLVLDKVTDMTKPVLLAKAYASLIDGEIDALTFEAIAHTLSIASLRDVLEFLSSPHGPDTTSWRERLASAGLLKVVDESWDRTVIRYQETKLGKSFRRAIGGSPSQGEATS